MGGWIHSWAGFSYYVPPTFLHLSICKSNNKKVTSANSLHGHCTNVFRWFQCSAFVLLVICLLDWWAETPSLVVKWAKRILAHMIGGMNEREAIHFTNTPVNFVTTRSLKNLKRKATVRTQEAEAKGVEVQFPCCSDLKCCQFSQYLYSLCLLFEVI